MPPSGSLSVVLATGAFVAGLALAVAGVVLLGRSRGLGLALLGLGFVVVVLCPSLASRGKARGPGEGA